MFVVTTEENMGDLALCQEWIGDLGRDEYQFTFVLASNLARFVDPSDNCVHFRPSIDIGETIAAAAAKFKPDAIIMASNSFWSMRHQRGAKFGRFPDELFGLKIPVLSFDPFEIGFRTKIPHSDQIFEFPEIPANVWRLRYMSRRSTEPNARHFCTTSVFARARAQSRENVLRKWGADPAKRTVIFPVSENRFKSIIESYPRYYLHLARLFSFKQFADVQFITVSPRPVPGLRHARNVLHVPHLPFDDFLALVAAADLYLSDSLISCMVNAFHMAMPVMLLVNSERNAPLAPGTFLNGRFFPYKIFPYGFTEVCDQLVSRFEIEGCFVETEVLDSSDFCNKLERLMFDERAYREVSDRCRAWKEARLQLPSPREVLDYIMNSRSANG
jgi:hypothetical protein